MTDFFKICILISVCAFVIILISKRDRELSLIISGSIYILVMLYIISQIGALFESINSSINAWCVIPNLNILIKIGGVAVACSVASIICENAGQKGLSSAIEIFSLVEILRLTIPIVKEFFLKVINIFGE